MKKAPLNLLKILPYLIFIAILVSIYIYRLTNEKVLKKETEIVIGQIIDCTDTPKSRIFEYEFYYKNKYYKGGNSSVGVITFSCSKINALKKNHQNFPIAISSNNPNVNQILLTEKNFNDIGFAFPDSMKKISYYLELDSPVGRNVR